MNIKLLSCSILFSLLLVFPASAAYDGRSGNYYLDESCASEAIVYEDGYKDGYNAGYDDGYKDGDDSGYYDGYESGESEGYDEGYCEGESEGYDSGYDEGYEKGASDTEERLDFDYRLIIGVGLFFIMVYDYGKSRER